MSDCRHKWVAIPEERRMCMECGFEDSIVPGARNSRLANDAYDSLVKRVKRRKIVFKHNGSQWTMKVVEGQLFLQRDGHPSTLPFNCATIMRLVIE